MTAAEDVNLSGDRLNHLKLEVFAYFTTFHSGLFHYVTSNLINILQRKKKKKKSWSPAEPGASRASKARLYSGN